METILIYLFGILQVFVISVMATTFIGLGIAWGVRVGGLWLLRAIARDDELTEWLKQVFSRREER